VKRCSHALRAGTVTLLTFLVALRLTWGQRYPRERMGQDLRRSEFDQLVASHLPATLRLGTRLTGDPGLAEDIVQNAMLKASKSWKTFRGDSSFSTWLTRIVINAFRDHLRRRAPEAALPEAVADSTDFGPLAHAIHGETGEAVAAAVSQLPPRQREVLILRVYEQLSTSETAKALEVTEESVRTSLHNAREALRRRLSSYLETG
jgi:RNA polymerase sigma-70 factor (ECF subfamily)